MKKFFSVVILASIVFALNIQNVEARDIYCGTYDSGYDAYLITETILSGENDYEGFIKCKVKALSGNSVIYLDYYFEYGEGGTVAFKNSQGFSGNFGGVYSRHGSPYPVENKIFDEAYRLMRQK